MRSVTLILLPFIFSWSLSGLAADECEKMGSAIRHAVDGEGNIANPPREMNGFEKGRVQDYNSRARENYQREISTTKSENARANSTATSMFYKYDEVEIKIYRGNGKYDEITGRFTANAKYNDGIIVDGKEIPFEPNMTIIKRVKNRETGVVEEVNRAVFPPKVGKEPLPLKHYDDLPTTWKPASPTTPVTISAENFSPSALENREFIVDPRIGAMSPSNAEKLRDTPVRIIDSKINDGAFNKAGQWDLGKTRLQITVQTPDGTQIRIYTDEMNDVRTTGKILPSLGH